ncbi:MAG TPA: hypothetical protein PLJ27_18280 [Polyangiaceae bacterium]|jgi:hypothetical protein|nr:MAG: hypothetical protein BWY17_03893 [Deltaproteobacteria bacterium ADurb.Bin207]HNS97391.1 hypothetical protein [Polyangiaceae bacterium]HNZ25112.1 hypothetical protein [Polyangiaceae bacterium]HOD22092.1 hypothetical protein [Polyangiaceae bacterium]HOE50650.1 hypothetical protein [Polyangiaceae bacterium]
MAASDPALPFPTVPWLWHSGWVLARHFPVFFVLFGSLLAGCDDKPPKPSWPPPPPARTDLQEDASLSKIFGIDASETPVDPPAPAGDFKRELAAFTSLDACVADRAPFDSVVGDAIDALGYDTLQRDSCRVLQAAREKNAALCEPILSSSLRHHCQSTVAVTLANPLLCPMVGANHDPLCIALARRDDRLCVSVASTDRVTCRAILSREPSACGQDARCARKAQRWKTFLPDNIERPQLGTRATVRMADLSDGGLLGEREYDLSRVIQGATVRHSPSGLQLELGESSSAAWPPSSMLTNPRISFRMQATPAVVRQGKHPIAMDAVAFEILIPHRPMTTSEIIHGSIVLDVDMLGLELGEPVRFVLETDVGPIISKQHLRLEVNTFVRDVVKIGPSIPSD